jgi:acyl-CoA synthetase (NDP forming)
LSERPIGIELLLRPQSIAVLGASDRPGSIGSIVLASLQKLGFDGAVWPINPKKDEILGYRCYSSLTDTPGVPDLVAICTRAETVPEHLENLGKLGSRAAVVYDGGFAEAGIDGRALQDRVLGICKKFGIALCGPNCMGAISFLDGVTTYKLPILDRARLVGNVALISQSGSITIGLLGDVRRFGFSHVISTGNEAVITIADYVDFLVDDSATEIIALFIESVRAPVRFRAALERAAEAGKPVVVLKVGRSVRASSAVVSHTGGLAGESRVFSEMLKRTAAIEVGELDEMTEVLAALQSKRRPHGSRIAVITGSGGQAEFVLDVAEANSIDLPPMDSATRLEAERVIGHFSGDGNPLDAWGNGDIQRNLPHAFGVFNRHPGYDAVVLCNENIDNAPIGRAEGVLKLFCEAARNSDKPYYCLNMRSGLMHTGNVEMLRDVGASMLSGVRQGLCAIDRIAQYETRRHFTRVTPVDRANSSPLRDETRKSINEHDAKQILLPFGIPIVAEQLVEELDEGLSAARRIGWPVVLKVISDAVPHKTEFGFVQLDLRDEEAFQSSWKILNDRARIALPAGERPRFLVQAMVKGGVEVFAGLRHDPDWGLALAFGVGGTLIEIIRESSIRLLPVCECDFDEMLRETRAWTLLSGVRRGQAADIDALKACLKGVAAFGEAAYEQLVELDLNPIMVLPAGQGCVVVDALIQLR